MKIMFDLIYVLWLCATIFCAERVIKGYCQILLVLFGLSLFVFKEVYFV